MAAAIWRVRLPLTLAISDPVPQQSDCTDHRPSAHQARPAGTETNQSVRSTRVVFLDHTAKASGGEIALVHLISGLGRDVDPIVILGEDGPIRARLEASGAQVEVVPLAASVKDRDRFAATPGPADVMELMKYIWRLSRHLRRLEPDVVHANSLKAGVYGGLAAKLARKPLIWHLRDRLSADYMSARNALIMRLTIRLLSRAVICNSESTKRTLGWREAAPVTKLLPPLPTAPTGSTSDEQFTVGMVGRLAPWKGQDLFLRAFATAFPDGKERAVIVGSAMFGESEYAASLVDLTRQLDIDNRVEFCGFVPDIGGLLAEFDVLVHASRSAEPFGQVVVEGMAAGLPVIAANSGGPAEIIDHGVDGLLFSANQVEDLAAALVFLRTDSGRRQRLGLAGKERARDFAPFKAARPVVQVYRDCRGRDSVFRRSFGRSTRSASGAVNGS